MNYLFFIADITPISKINELTKLLKWISNSNVMLELGYTIAVKPMNRILITYDEKYKEDLLFHFDLQSYQNCSYNTENNDFSKLNSELERLLKRLGI